LIPKRFSPLSFRTAAGMIGLLCFTLAVLAFPFKSRLRLEAENAALRHQLMVLRRRGDRANNHFRKRRDALCLEDDALSPAGHTNLESTVIAVNGIKCRLHSGKRGN
jgi:hypothetical protein